MHRRTVRLNTRPARSPVNASFTPLQKGMGMKRPVILLFFLSALSLPCACTLPQYIWPQKDIGFQEINQPSLEKSLLVASRNSEFKSAVVQRIEDAYQGQDVYVRIIGIEDLKYEDANEYSVVVLINTAMGWEIDRKVQHFIDRHGDLDTMIVLTTSGGGDVVPDTEKYRIDAVSSASVLDETEDIADDIISKINSMMAK